MVSTSEGFTDNSLISYGPSVTVRNPSAKKLLRQFNEVLDVKQKTAVCRLGADKSDHKAIMSVTMLWSSIPKRCVHTKINYQVRNVFTIGFYRILRLCNPQQPTIVLNFPLMITLKHSWFQNCYCRCLSKNFTISWLIHQKRV